MSFQSGTQSELLYSLNAPVTKNTYTTEAAFTGVAGTNTVCTIDANTFRNDNPTPIGRPLWLTAMGTIGNTASATFAINLGLDTTSGTKANAVAVMAATAPPVAAGAPWNFDAWLVCTAFATSTMTLQVNGRFRMDAVASGAAASAAALETGFAATVTGLNPRADLYVELFGTWSASNAANTTTVHQLMLYGMA